MNGQEQKERTTAITLVNSRIDALADAFDKELTADKEELKSLIAEMVDGEAQFRKANIQNEMALMRGYIDRQLAEMSASVLYFINLPWYRRWAWCLLGSSALLWFKQSSRQTPTPTLPVKERISSIQQPYHGEKPR